MREKKKKVRVSEDEEMMGQLQDDLFEFLSNWSEHINTSNRLLQLKIEELADAAVQSISDYVDIEEDDDGVLSLADMDDFSFGGDDDV